MAKKKKTKTTAQRKLFTQQMYQAGIDAGLTDAAARVMGSQAALESNYGLSAPGNNFFGIKAGKSWKGETQLLWTSEVYDGKRVRVQQKFRKYATPEEGIADRIAFMDRAFPGFSSAETVGAALDVLQNGKFGKYYTEPQANYESGINTTNTKYLGGNPVPPKNIGVAIGVATQSDTKAPAPTPMPGRPASLDEAIRMAVAPAPQQRPKELGGSGNVVTDPRWWTATSDTREQTMDEQNASRGIVRREKLPADFDPMKLTTLPPPPMAELAGKAAKVAPIPMPGRPADVKKPKVEVKKTPALVNFNGKMVAPGTYRIGKKDVVIVDDGTGKGVVQKSEVPWYIKDATEGTLLGGIVKSELDKAVTAAVPVATKAVGDAAQATGAVISEKATQAKDAAVGAATGLFDNFANMFSSKPSTEKPMVKKQAPQVVKAEKAFESATKNIVAPKAPIAPVTVKKPSVAQAAAINDVSSAVKSATSVPQATIRNAAKAESLMAAVPTPVPPKVTTQLTALQKAALAQTTGVSGAVAAATTPAPLAAPAPLAPINIANPAPAPVKQTASKPRPKPVEPTPIKKVVGGREVTYTPVKGKPAGYGQSGLSDEGKQLRQDMAWAF